MTKIDKTDLENIKLNQKEKKFVMGGIFYAKSRHQMVYFDIGGPPRKNFSKNYQSGPLSFEYFIDGIKILVKAGIKIIVQPGGSIRDQEIINFANKAKIKILKVKKKIIKKYGAVSHECCKAMVQNLSKISKSKINISITGIAGPGGGSKEKPVGLVYIGIKKGKNLLIKENKFKSRKRNFIQKLTVRTVIKIISKII